MSAWPKEGESYTVDFKQMAGICCLNSTLLPHSAPHLSPSPPATAPRAAPLRNGSRAGDPSLEPGAALPHRALPPGTHAVPLPSNAQPAHISAPASHAPPLALAGGEGFFGGTGAWIQALLPRLLQVHASRWINSVSFRYLPRGLWCLDSVWICSRGAGGGAGSVIGSYAVSVQVRGLVVLKQFSRRNWAWLYLFCALNWG
jgi:hypothetical protein